LEQTEVMQSTLMKVPCRYDIMFRRCSDKKILWLPSWLLHLESV